METDERAPESRLHDVDATVGRFWHVAIGSGTLCAMRRPTDADMSFEAFERMLRTNRALRLVLADMAPEATLEDARLLHRRMKQVGRARCSFLDADLGIRDR